MTPEEIKVVVEQVLASQTLAQDRLKIALETAEKEIQHLRDHLATKDAMIASQEGALASKEEIISLLRGGYNRPN
ncbi:MAG: hypothetical protein ACRYFX_19780 [Janthinobacterium lividum]